MPKKRAAFIFALKIALLVSNFGHIQCPKPMKTPNKLESVSFGVKHGEIPAKYTDFLFNESTESELGWRIGAFLLDQTIEGIYQEFFIHFGKGKGQQNEDAAAAEMEGKTKISQKSKKGRNRGGNKGGKKVPVKNALEEEPSITKEDKERMMKSTGEFFAKFELKYSSYKQRKEEMETNLKKKPSPKFGWTEIRELFLEIFFDPFFDQYILLHFGQDFGDEWKKIQEINKLGEEVKNEEKEQMVEGNVRLLYSRMHLNELIKLILYSNESRVRGELQKLSQESGKNIKQNEVEKIEEEKRKKIEFMKKRMREIVEPETVHKSLEIPRPFLLRIDIIEPTELFRIFSNALRIPAGEKRNRLIKRLMVATLFGEIWKLRKQRTGLRARLEVCWNDCLHEEEEEENTNTLPMDEQLLHLWMEFQGHKLPTEEGEEMTEYGRKAKEFNATFLRMNRANVARAFRKVGEFRKFLDENAGTRARILEIFNCKAEIEELFFEGSELSPLVEMNPNENEIMDLLHANYLKAFEKKNKNQKENSVMKISILLDMNFLDEKFGQEGDENLQGQWAKCRPMFFLFLDQLALDSDGNFCQIEGSIYRNMLYRLRKFLLTKERGKKRANLREMLKEYLAMLKQETKGKIELVDKSEQIEMLKIENLKMIKRMKENEKYSELGNVIEGDGSELFEIFDNIDEHEQQETASEPVEEGTKSVFEEYSMWNSNFLASYKNFLSGNDNFKAEVQLDALMWHYKSLMDKLLKNPKMTTNFILAVFKDLWPVLAKLETGTLEKKYEKLCLTQSFMQKLFLKNEIHALPEWAEIGKLTRMPYLTDEMCLDKDKKSRQFYHSFVVDNLLSEEIKLNLYFDYLDWLIMNFHDFQQFLLKANLIFKDQILKMLSVLEEENLLRFEVLDKFEKMHPKWLRIHQIHKGMQWNLLKMVLGRKSYMQRPKYSHERLDIALLIGTLEWMGMASAEHGLGRQNAKLFEMLKMKAKEVLDEVYEEKGEHFVSQKNLCYMTRFLQMIKLEGRNGEEESSSNTPAAKYLDIIGINETVEEEAIRGYSSEFCKQSETEQKNAETNRIEMLQRIHFEFIANNDEQNEILELAEQFGGMTRQQMLMPDLTQSEIIASKNFWMDSSLREHLKGAILAGDGDDENREANRMAVNFFSWARFIEKHLEQWMNAGPSEGKIKPEILMEIWRSHEIQDKIIRKYDQLGDLDLNSLRDIYRVKIMKMQSGIWEMLNEAKENLMEKEKIKMEMKQIIEDKNEELNKKWDTEKMVKNKMVQYVHWVQALNREQFFEQLETNVEIVEEKAERQEFVREFERGFNMKGEKAKEHLFEKTNQHLFELIGVENNVLEKITEKLSKAGLGKSAAEKRDSQKDSSESSKHGEDDENEKIDEKQKRIEESKAKKARRKNRQKDQSSSTAAAQQTEPQTQLGMSSQQPADQQPIDQKENKNEHETAEMLDQQNEEEDKDVVDVKKEIIEENRQENKVQEELLTPEMEAKRIANQKARLNKKDRRLRKKAQREENSSPIIVDTEKGEAESSRPTIEKEEVKQKRTLNEHLIVEELAKFLRSTEYGEFPNASNVDEENRGEMASQNGYLTQSEFAILDVMELLANWNAKSRMLISGSLQLKINSANSDIDLIVLMPYKPSENWSIVFERIFMGNSKVKCKIAERKCGENDDKNSLYCFLCKAEKVIFLQKIPSRIPLIKMRLSHHNNVPIDINMALVPEELIRDYPTINQQQESIKKIKKLKEKMEEIMEKQPNLKQINELIRKIIVGVGEEIIAKKNKGKSEKSENVTKPAIVGAMEFSKPILSERDKREGMIMALSGYQANKQMVELLSKNEEKYKSFQLATLAMKLWTKNHFIYSGLFGFFNGPTLQVMICKLALESGENASALKLLAQFFRTYHKSENEVLEEIYFNYPKNDKKIRNILDWSSKMESATRHGVAPGWQVITPGFPTQNAAFNIIPATRKIINAELGKALEKVDQIEKLLDMAEETPPPNLIHEKLTNLLIGPKFIDKYNIFMAIVCKYSTHNARGPEFCNFLEFRLRLNLPEIDMHQIDYSHILPDRIIDQSQCPEPFRDSAMEKNKNLLCTIWVAGIKPKKEQFDWSAVGKSTKAIEMISNLKNEYLLRSGEKPTEELKKEFGAIFRYIHRAELIKWMPQKY